MTTTTSYGTWLEHTGGQGTTSLRGEIERALKDHAGDFDVDAIERDYRAAIETRLPDAVTFNGDEFYGPHPEPDNAADWIQDAIHAMEGEPFWAIVEKHDKAAAAERAAAADELSALGQEMNPEGYR